MEKPTQMVGIDDKYIEAIVYKVLTGIPDALDKLRQQVQVLKDINDRLSAMEAWTENQVSIE